ncbi:hypothetical protein BC940DRAFT_346404, partial [Gongronella butleri]
MKAPCQAILVTLSALLVVAHPSPLGGNTAGAAGGFGSITSSSSVDGNTAAAAGGFGSITSSSSVDGNTADAAGGFGSITSSSSVGGATKGSIGTNSPYGGAGATGGYIDCVSVLSCLNEPYIYGCYGGKCQPPRPGFECVGEGSVPSTTTGPKKCCAPFEVLAPGKPCELRKMESPDPNRGKTGSKCSNVLDCFGLWDYCIDNICQPMRPGKDCVAEGNMPSSRTGSGSCCPPLVTTLGKKCETLDTTRCSRDAICSTRRGGSSPMKCCHPGTDKSYCTERNNECGQPI